MCGPCAQNSFVAAGIQVKLLEQRTSNLYHRGTQIRPPPVQDLHMKWRQPLNDLVAVRGFWVIFDHQADDLAHASLPQVVENGLKVPPARTLLVVYRGTSQGGSASLPWFACVRGKELRWKCNIPQDDVQLELLEE